MKKVLMLSMALAMFSANANDDGSGGCGFYIGGGLLWNNTGEKMEFQENNPVPSPNYTESNSNFTNIGGTLLFGVQRVFDSSYPICFGLELGCDFARRHEDANPDKISNEGQAGRVYNLYTWRNGIVPFAAFRIGYISHEYKTMVYFKAGVSYAKSKEKYDEFNDVDQNGHPMPGGWGRVDAWSGTMEVNSVMPILALGVEKSMAKDITARLEGEYRFGRSKKKTTKLGDNMKFTQKDAFTVRALVVYNVKI